MPTARIYPFYPYVVRAISDVIGVHILFAYRQWMELTTEEKCIYLKNPAISRRMAQIAENDAKLRRAGAGGSY